VGNQFEKHRKKQLKIALKDAYIDLGLSFEKFEPRARKNCLKKLHKLALKGA
jgi:hypothetical protein